MQKMTLSVNQQYEHGLQIIMQKIEQPLISKIRLSDMVTLRIAVENIYILKIV